jgi:hypothetical protein
MFDSYHTKRIIENGIQSFDCQEVPVIASLRCVAATDKLDMNQEIFCLFELKTP